MPKLVVLVWGVAVFSSAIFGSTGQSEYRLVLLSNFYLLATSCFDSCLFVVLELLACSILPPRPRWELTAESRADLRSLQGASLAVLGPADPFLRARYAL